jgi:hypothetical protein
MKQFQNLKVQHSSTLPQVEPTLKSKKKPEVKNDEIISINTWFVDNIINES